jgi:diguanylate cyclase (GGDEF)-like protein/PAS domain S-box-containing protein
MYHCELTINLIGLEPWITKIIVNMAPRERFTHKFKITNVFTGVGHLQNQVVIMDARVGMAPAMVRMLTGSKNKVILVATNETLRQLKKDDLASLNDVWTEPLSEDLVRFFFARLQLVLQKEKEDWLHRTYLDKVIDTLPDMVWFKDAQGAHLKVNDAFCAAVGKSKRDVQGRGHYYIWGLTKEQYEKGEFVCLETEKTVMEARKTCVFDEQVLAKDGLRQLKTYKTPIFDESGNEVLGTLGIARDVTMEKQYKQMILDMANTDDLTGLANRRHFISYFGEHRQDKPVTLLYLDVDYFKQINDRFGHQNGDEALVAVAYALNENFRDGFITRLGGDEFLITLLQPFKEREIKNRIAQVQEALQDFALTPLSLSIGIAFTDNPKVTLDDLLYYSDEALYEAKREGKGRYCIYNERHGALKPGQAKTYAAGKDLPVQEDKK